MADIKMDEALWSSSMSPQGVVERWFAVDGERVATGRTLAEIRIEGALHEITAPSGGKLSIVAGRNAIVEPGSLLGRLAG